MLERIVLRAEKECFAPKQRHEYLSNMDEAHQLIKPLMDKIENPSCWAMALTKANRIIAVDQLPSFHWEGLPSANKPFAKFGLLANAAKVIAFHNHRSGGIETTDMDDCLTACLAKSMRDIDITLEDHLLIGEEGYFSYATSASHLLSPNYR